MTTNRSTVRRKVFLGTTLLALGVFLAIGASSCGTLPSISANQCGNHVVEPEIGEACDEQSARCGAPSTDRACRFICVYQDPALPPCPPGFGCGLDEICRKSNGLSESPISIAGGGTQKLLTGDFDGDDRSDVVAVGFSTVDVHFLTSEGYVDSTARLPNEVGLPGVGDVNGDGLDDIVLSLDHSMGVLLGQDSRSFTPESHTTMFIRPNTRRLVPLGAYFEESVILSFSERGMNTDLDLITLNDKGGHELRPANPPTINGLIEGAIATRGVDVGGTPCAIVAFEVAGGITNPARLAIGVYCDTLTIDTVDFAGGYPWGGAYFADADNDGNPDLFFGVTDSEGDNALLSVIKSNPNGPPLPSEDFLSFSKGNCLEAFPQLASAPLAIADVNGDGYADVVDNRGVLLQNPNGPFTRICHSYSYVDPNDKENTPVAWTNAVIGDFNGDGQNDLLASRKAEGVLDLWIWQPGGFNTIPIFAGAPVEELVTADLDGDTIADAAFRFGEPMGGAGPRPLLAMFGNPLALPSTPQPLGFLEHMQHIAAGRIRGASLAQASDVLSDLVVISSGMKNGDPMPLTLFQGNATRNLVSPLSLKQDTTSPTPVVSTEQVYGLFVSDFATSACDRFEMSPEEVEATPSNVVALGDGGRIWLAGCKSNGSSVVVQENLAVKNVSFLFAPVDRDSSNDALAIFMSNPPFIDGSGADPMERTLGLGIIEHRGGEMFSTLPDPMPEIGGNILLASKNNLDVPFTIADIDNNGLKDVIVTEKSGNPRTIHVFWNGDAENQSGDMRADAVTKFSFVPQDNDANIKDIAALNIDGDGYRELAILTKDYVYFAKLEHGPGTDSDGEPLLAAGRPLKMHLDGKPFAKIRSGEALLAIDADSDGIDDLLVADTGKLLLFIGTEDSK